MIQEGDILTAEVVRLAEYGAYFDHGGSSILILGPDASPGGDVSVEELFEVGQQVRIRVGHFNATANTYRGYLPEG